jgi:hypothetical protein
MFLDHIQKLRSGRKKYLKKIVTMFFLFKNVRSNILRFLFRKISKYINYA